MLHRSTLCTSLALLTLPGLAAAQGADACGSAQPISGTGTFAFDNTTATTDGVGDSLCYAFGSDQIENDVWFDWTPPSAGLMRLETCGTTTVDSKVAVLDGGCGGVVLACNDDSCGLQSSVSWTAQAASTYLLRVGTFPGAAGGVGTFSIEAIVPQLNPANGHYYLAVSDVGITWQDARTAAQANVFQGAPGELATLTDQVENDFVFGLGDVNNYWVGGYQDLNDPNYSEPDGAWKWVTGEPWSYTNWLAGEPNNTGAYASEDFLELLQSASFGETWNDVHPLEHSRGYVIEWGGGVGTPYCFGDGAGGTCPCGNTGGAGAGCANSSGAGGEVTTAGTPSVTADDLSFAASNLLVFQPALLFAGDNAVNGGDGIPFGDGLRCAGQNVLRLGVVTPDANGDAAWGPGLVALGGWSAGDLRRFQVWYRDPIGGPCGFGFNLTNGIELAFTP